MPKGTTLNFNKESQLFAKALQTEHGALGDLLEDIGTELAAKSLNADVVKAARDAHERVRFQRARTEAARGRR